MMNTCIPVKPDHVIINDTALVAQARRQPTNARVRNWLDDVVEESKSAQVEDQTLQFSPLRFDEPIFICDSRRGSLVKISFPDNMSDATTALNSKPSFERVPFEKTASLSSGSAKAYSPEPTVLPAERVRITRVSNDRSRVRPRLSIKVHKSPSANKYAVQKDKALPLLPNGRMYEHPSFEVYAFPEPPSAAHRRRAEERMGYTVPSEFRAMSPTTMARLAIPDDVFVRTTHGVEKAKIPRAALQNDVSQLRLAATRMQHKSERMLAAALRERSELDKDGFVIDDLRRQQRRVLAEAAAPGKITSSTVISAGRSNGTRTPGSAPMAPPRGLTRNMKMTARDRELGFKPAGVIRRNWNDI